MALKHAANASTCIVPFSQVTDSSPAVPAPYPFSGAGNHPRFGERNIEF